MYDDDSQVRQSACLSFPSVCRKIDDVEHRRSFTIEATEALTSNGEDVRGAFLEILGEVIHIFASDVSGPPEELLQIYLDDRDLELGRYESEWDMIASYNVSVCDCRECQNLTRNGSFRGYASL